MGKIVTNMLPVISGVILMYCDNAPPRDPRIVAVEAYERKKPALSPAGGLYLDTVAISTTGNARNLEYSLTGSYRPWPGENLILTQSALISVRDTKMQELEATESYTLVHDFPGLTLDPPPGEYAGAKRVALLGLPRNASAEINTPAGFVPYQAEEGIIVRQTQMLEIRQCTALRCSAVQIFDYTIRDLVPLAERNLTAAELTELNEAAKSRYSQTQPTGLAALLDEAKLRVIQNPSLIPDAAVRRRFLTQENIQTAENLCTTIARYLYVKTRRLALGVEDPPLPEFADYYIRHIARGDITVDTWGQNFDWVQNESALVRPYLPETALGAFEFSRRAEYPTDHALIDALTANSANVTLLRDGPAGLTSTHTFIAINNGEDYTMIDTYFPFFSGSPLRGWSGFSGYYAYRFGPQGSRFLHYIYGY